MMPAQSAIARFHRDLTLGRFLNFVLLAGVLLAMMFGGMINNRVGDVLLLVVILGIRMMLGYQSIRGSRLAAGSPSLIAAGQLDLAEEQIESALRSFSLFRGAKMMTLHHLAVLRHAQRRWQDAAILCRALLGQRLGTMQGISRQSRLILADALLEMGDTRGAYEAIAGLYDQRLSLGEAMNLLVVQLDYEGRIGAWGRMMENVQSKVELCELMPTAGAARAQALLALAAKRTGRIDWAQWLRRRVELLVDVQRLAKDRPMLWELWESAPQ